MKTVKDKISKAARALILTALPLGGVAGGLLSCSDTWDDHYDKTSTGPNTASGTLWQAIQQNGELSNFASVVQATGYDRSLGGSQVFTVFAPLNSHFSKSDADALIAQYRSEKQQNVNDEDNTVVKEFVQNHIALYNYSVSSLSNDSIVLMNGKYAVLRTDRIDKSTFSTFNKLYDNGVLYTVNNPVDYSANIFEAFRKTPDLDSVSSFLFNPYYYKKKFDASSSVEGGIDELGRTIYLDSVFYQSNTLFRTLGQLNAEDSLYWMLAPTNEAWNKMLDEYSQYFKYHSRAASLLNGVGDFDSLVYTNTRLAMLQGTSFSYTFNKDFLSQRKTSSTVKDSVSSTMAKLDYTNRLRDWGANFSYYQYFDPMNGVLAESDSISCSNGRLIKVNDWKISSLQTFNRWIAMECEGSKSLRSIGKTVDSKKDSVDLAKVNRMSVDNPIYKNRIWSESYAEVQPTTDLATELTFNITDVLSNMGYDIYLVTAPALANDSNSTVNELLPTVLRCTLNYPDHNGRSHSDVCVTSQSTKAGNFTTSGTESDYLLLAENFKFPICTYGLNESEPSITLKVENRTTNKQVTAGTHQKTMRLDCILLVPHGTLELTDDLQGDDVASAHLGKKAVLMYPFGRESNKRYYMLR